MCVLCSIHGLVTTLHYVFEQQITIFDSESEDQMAPDAAILTTTLKGTYVFPWVVRRDIFYRRHGDISLQENSGCNCYCSDSVGLPGTLE